MRSGRRARAREPLQDDSRKNLVGPVPNTIAELVFVDKGLQEASGGPVTLVTLVHDYEGIQIVCHYGIDYLPMALMRGQKASRNANTKNASLGASKASSCQWQSQYS